MSHDNNIINIGILAHVDAGKTTITEQFLFFSGAIRTAGSVDKGTSSSDNLSVERERGISVRCTSTSFEWNNQKINLIDTPGHVDFSTEVERSMLAMDSAILVISAAEGVQAYTETLWKALRQLKIPTILFINKIDRAGVDLENVINEITKELSKNIVVLQSITMEGNEEVPIHHLINSQSAADLPVPYIESILSNDESLLEKYLDGDELQPEELKKSIVSQTTENKLFPVLLGSAKYSMGMEDLLNAVSELLPRAAGNNNSPVSGIVFKVEHDKSLGRLAHIRLFNGTLKNRDLVSINGQNMENKISQVRKLIAQKYEESGVVHAGDTATLTGLNNIRAGDIIGIPDGIQNPVQLNVALLTVSVTPEDTSDYSDLVRALQILTDEDPALDLLWLKEERELHIKAMGIIQLEILESVLMDRFGISVTFGEPSVIYKETPAKKGEAYEEYTMPKPCWAVVRFLISPGERGSGVIYRSEVGINDIARPYQQEIERSISRATKQGIFGWEVTDLEITLIKGEHHKIHSRAGDFAVATHMALLKGLKETGTILLEPLLNYSIDGPEESLGKVISSLTLIRAAIGSPEIVDGKFKISGTMPVATSLDYTAKLNTLTGGKGKLATRFCGFQPAPPEIEVIIPYRGISPLDRAKYILWARKAIQ